MVEKSIIDLLRSVFGSGSLSADGINFQVSCPECRKSKNTQKRKLHIRIDDLRYHCWVCGLKGKNILFWAKKIDPRVEVGRYSNKQNKQSNSEAIDDSVDDIKLPDGLLPVFRKTADPDIRAVRNYLLKRGITEAKMRRWRIMTSKKGTFRRYALIPSFDQEGQVNYYVGRSIDDLSIRYRNAKQKKSNIIFNEIDIDWSKDITLVEGVFDAMKCPENTIPILGSSISENSLLLSRLSKNQPSVTVSLDPDLPEKAYNVAEMIQMTGCKTYIAFAPKDSDLGALSYSNASKILKNKKEYSPYLKIRHKIGTLRSGSVF